MSDLDLQGLHSDVTEIIVQTIYLRHGPAPIMGAGTANVETRKQRAMDEYRNNPRFKTVVDIMASAITRAAEKRHK